VPATLFIAAGREQRGGGMVERNDEQVEAGGIGSGQFLVGDDLGSPGKAPPPLPPPVGRGAAPPPPVLPPPTPESHGLLGRRRRLQLLPVRRDVAGAPCPHIRSKVE